MSADDARQPQLRLASRVVDRMKARGIELRLGVGLKEATGSAVTLTDGSRIETRSIIATVGIGTNPLLRDLPLTLSRGRVPCDRFCRVEGYPGVYAVGDNAAVDFTLDTSRIASCSSSTRLTQYNGCSIYLTFAPTDTYTRTAHLRVTDNATGSPHLIALSGVGAPQSVIAAPASLDEHLGFVREQRGGRDEHWDGYRELVARAGPLTIAHETLVTVTVDRRRLPGPSDDDAVLTTTSPDIFTDEDMPSFAPFRKPPRPTRHGAASSASSIVRTGFTHYSCALGR